MSESTRFSPLIRTSGAGEGVCPACSDALSATCRSSWNKCGLLVLCCCITCALFWFQDVQARYRINPYFSGVPGAAFWPVQVLRSASVSDASHHSEPWSDTARPDDSPYRADARLEHLTRAWGRAPAQEQFCRGFRRRPAALAPQTRPWGEMGELVAEPGYCPHSDSVTRSVNPFPEKPSKATYSSAKPQRYHYGDLNPLQATKSVDEGFGTMTRFDQPATKSQVSWTATQAVWSRPLEHRQESWRRNRPW